MDIEKGKTLNINLVAKSDLTSTGEREVFFELNGQMRSVMVKDKVAMKVSAHQTFTGGACMNIHCSNTHLAVQTCRYCLLTLLGQESTAQPDLFCSHNATTK